MRLPVLASLALALALAPVEGETQQKGQRGQPPDTTRMQRQQGMNVRDPRLGRQDTTQAGIIREEAGGEVAIRSANRGLTQTQVRQLQERLRGIGCAPGEVDGMIGPQTRQALACARRQRGVESMNLNELLRSLGLSFTATDSLAVGAAARVEAQPPGVPRIYDYGDPTFVRDTGVMVVNLDTMPADAMGPGGVFVATGTIARVGGNVWLRETSQQMRRDTTGRTPPDTAVYRPVAPPARAETATPAVRRDLTPTARRDTVPVMRDTTPAMRRDTTPAVRRDTARMTRDTTRAVRRDTAATPARTDSLLRVRMRADSLRLDSLRRARDTTGVVADSTLRRMRDELLLMPPPPTRQAAPDTTRAARDTTRATPDTTRTPPDTTRRRPPPPPR